MEINQVSLVLVDISGYTRFLQWNKTSLLHAEMLITELLETVISTAEYPLELNKLEGDAALLFTRVAGQPEAVAKDVANQVRGFFQAFEARQKAFAEKPECPCDSCQSVGLLRLKAFVHQGEAVIKQVRQFEELAGEDVILIHRLLKNPLPEREYILMTEAFKALSGGYSDLPGRQAPQKIEDLGPVNAWVYFPSLRSQEIPAAPPARQPGLLARLRVWWEARQVRAQRNPDFHNLPY
jgi:hypothetical protein